MREIENIECLVIGDTPKKKENLLLKDTTSISGIYKIINKINGKYYVGSSIDIYQRWRNHKSQLKRNIHKNPHLQNAWNKYGENNFQFIIEKEVSLNQLLEEEQKLIDLHFGKSYCYNINSGVTKLYGNYNPFYGKHHTEISKQKMGGAIIDYTGHNNPFYGKIHTKETKETWKKTRNYLHMKGENHSQFDHKIYTFQNNNEIFIGTRYDFTNLYNNLSKGNICWLIKGKHKSVKGWTIKNEDVITNTPI